MTASVRALRLTDVPALLTHDSGACPNQAVTFARCARAGDVQKSDWGRLAASLLTPQGRQFWISRAGWSLVGLTTVRPRSGRAAWEIDKLICRPDSDAHLLDLLDRAVASAGAKGAGRLFLRLSTRSPALDAARRHGFVVVTEEARYHGNGSIDAQAPPPPAARRRTHGDDLALFRLYTQSVPQEVRWHTALSPAEWRAAAEPLGRSGGEWVIASDSDSLPAALVRHCHDQSGARVALLTDGTPHNARRAVAFALTCAAGPLDLLLPAHAVSEAAAAEAAGLEPVERFLLLVRPIAQRTRRLSMAEHAADAVGATVR